MSVICPTVTAYNMDDYTKQLRLASSLSERVHIDLMDNQFTDSNSPSLNQIWLPSISAADIHLMYKRPMQLVDRLIELKPHLVIIHSEAELDHMHFVALLHQADIMVGLALLQDTSLEDVQDIIHSFDHVLIFSGNLGHHGGHADMAIVDKVREVRLEYPEVEIGWDGGINDNNVQLLIDAEVDVLNVGGFIQNSKDPEQAYEKLQVNL